MQYNKRNLIYLLVGIIVVLCLTIALYRGDSEEAVGHREFQEKGYYDQIEKQEPQEQGGGITKQQFAGAIKEMETQMSRCREDVSFCRTDNCPSPPFEVDLRVGKKWGDLYVGNNCEPWMKREAILVLDRLLNKNMDVLEFSSGSSTIWLLKRVKSLISIENDLKWMASVQGAYDKLEKINLASWRYIGHSSETTGPDWTFSRGVGKYFNAYVTTPLPKEMAGKFDVVIVDGRARIACLRRALFLVKPVGGILVLDNTSRENYKDQHMVIPPWFLKYVTPTSPLDPEVQATIWITQADPWLQ